MGILLIIAGIALIFSGIKMEFINSTKTANEFAKDMGNSDINKVARTGFGMAFRMYGKVMMIVGGIFFLLFGLMIVMLF